MVRLTHQLYVHVCEEKEEFLMYSELPLSQTLLGPMIFPLTPITLAPLKLPPKSDASYVL